MNLLCINQNQYLTTEQPDKKKKKKIRILTESLSPKKISLNDVLENNYVISQAKIKFMN